jgi:hypothetical protein
VAGCSVGETVAKAKPTKADLALLLNPPTEGTWICPQEWKKNDGSIFRHINSEGSKECLYCGAKKPSNPEKLWPAYVEACKKVGVPVGTMYKVSEQGFLFGKELVRVRGSGWKLRYPPETEEEPKPKVKRKGNR